MSNDIALATNAEAYRASTDAATLCKEIVVRTAVSIQNRRYVCVEGWQALAVAHGCAAGSRDVERIEGGVRAIGEVRRMSDGTLIATAEGFVGEDEPTWYGGVLRGKTLPKRADYAIRAMAQTRAISRACRSAFAHVVVMMDAGLATTPAEEVPFGGFDNAEAEPKIAGIHKIKERLRAMMEAGNDPTITLEKFKALKRENKDDLKAIRDANHGWWTGDGEEFEGYQAWMAKREAELDIDNAVSVAVDSMKRACTSRLGLEGWMEANAEAISTFDGEDSRRFQAEYDAFEAGLTQVDTLNAG